MRSSWYDGSAGARARAWRSSQHLYSAKIASGGAYISAEVAEQLALGAMPGASTAPHESLSAREFEVFRLLVAGVSVTDIASQLTLSVKTVSTHKANLMQKMGLDNQTDLIRYALRHGLAE